MSVRFNTPLHFGLILSIILIIFPYKFELKSFCLVIPKVSRKLTMKNEAELKLCV